MPFIPVPDTAELVMTYTLLNGNVAKNVMHFREATAGSWNASLLASLVTVVNDWDNASWKALRSNQVSLTHWLARDLSVENGAVYELSTSHVGSLASPAMPGNVTFCLKALTGFAGRSFRGRLYFVGLAEGDVTGDFITSTKAEAMKTALNTLRTNAIAALFYPVVVSRFHNNAPRETGVATDITTWAYSDLRVDTQRRRLIGTGE